MDHPIQITGRHLEITDAIRNVVLEKFQKLERHFSRITHIHVTLSASKVDRSKPKVNRRKVHTAKALVLLPNKKELVAEETMDDLYTSINVIVDILDRELHDAVGKMKDRTDTLTDQLRHH